MKKLSEIEKAGIFFDASSNQCRKEVKSFIKQLTAKQVKVWSLGYFDTRDPDDNFISDKSVYFATLKDFSFFFLPKTEEVKEFTDRPLDALFVFSANNSLPATSVINSSIANLKVGFAGIYGKTLDLTFEIPGHEPENLTEQIIRYL